MMEQAKRPPAPSRAHDYLFDPAFIVSDAKDYARTAFAAALQSTQVAIQPNYQTMFSEIKRKPRCKLLYHPNCRLPEHMMCSYPQYEQNRSRQLALPAPEFGGKDRFKFSAAPRAVLPLSPAPLELRPPAAAAPPTGPPRHVRIQTVYRESSAQTIPWQPEAFVSKKCVEKPEPLYLDKLEWGPGKPYRKGDLPADFHTTEIINKMRHARRWMSVAEQGRFPRWMKRRADIVKDVEHHDWIFREAEIDELQEIRLSLLHQLQDAERGKLMTEQARKLNRVWTEKKKQMEEKIEQIHRVRDRELRKLRARHSAGGAAERAREARGGGDAVRAAADPAGGTRAPRARWGYQARRRHAAITYHPQLLVSEDHRLLDSPPAWVFKCAVHAPPDPHTLCERETKWSESFLAKLHEELMKVRLGAARTAGPLRVLQARHTRGTARPRTPAVDAVTDADEGRHQHALLLQRLLRGRAVQALMYAGRVRAAQLTGELQGAHGLQREDRVRVARQEARARDYHVLRAAAGHKEEAISALVDELCGGAVSSALDFLDKELRRLREERKQHAFILIALREKSLRESAEAGRRQTEVQRLREHDEMFKRVLGVTQETVDAYLKDIVSEGVELFAERDAAAAAAARADTLRHADALNASMSTAEQNEVVAELVQHFLLPEVQRGAARHRVAAAQALHAGLARQAVCDLLDRAEIKREYCVQCGEILDETCRCRRCVGELQPAETAHRRDPRWQHTTSRERPKEKEPGERIPPHLEFRCMLDTLVDEAVAAARARAYEMDSLIRTLREDIDTRFTIQLDATLITKAVVADAVGETCPPLRRHDYRHTMRRIVPDALARSHPHIDPNKIPVPRELPTQTRARALAAEDAARPWCRCDTAARRHTRRVVFGLEHMSEAERRALLPSELRVLEDMRRCKCDQPPSPTPTEASVGASSAPSSSHTGGGARGGRGAGGAGGAGAGSAADGSDLSAADIHHGDE